MRIASPSHPPKQLTKEQQEWVETTATVYFCEEPSPSGPVFDSRRFKPFFFHPAQSITSFEVFYSFSVDGEPYEGKFRAGEPVEIGHKFAILYDPRNPFENTGGEPLQKKISRGDIFAWTIFAALAAIFFWLKNRWS